MTIEKSISTLELKVKKLSYAVIGLSVMLCISIFSNLFELDVADASAQGYIITPPNVPMAVEAQSFILKDAQGNIRGMWSAEDKNTTFATSFKGNKPFISLQADDDKATLTMGDKKNNQIFLTSSTQNGQSLTMGNINNASHNVLLSHVNDEANFELISAKTSRIGLSARNILIEALGGTSDVVIAEKNGNYINLNSSNLGSKISFIDPYDYENLKLEYKNGESELTLVSPGLKSKKIINAK